MVYDEFAGAFEGVCAEAVAFLGIYIYIYTEVCSFAGDCYIVEVYVIEARRALVSRGMFRSMAARRIL